MKYQQNYIYWTSFWTKLFGVSQMELFGQQKAAATETLIDQELTRGYKLTLLYVKSSYYTVTNVAQYVFIDLLAHLAAVGYGLWWLYRFLHWLFPMRMNQELDQVERVYRVNEQDDSTSVMQLKNAMLDMADRINSQQ